MVVETYDVSLVLPVYNVEQYISHCLDSLLSQSFQGSLQIILVEDKSPDNSLSICREYVKKYDNITLIEHAENGGSSVARNSGLEQVQGKYFIFVDPDDIVPAAALETLYNTIEESGADIVKGNNTSFKTTQSPCLVNYSVKEKEEYIEGECFTVLLKHEKLRGHPWGKIFRTSSFKGIRFTPGYRMAQDLLFCAEVFSKASRLVLIPDVVYQYRIHNSGATGRKYETGAYLSWLKCITAVGAFVVTRQQKKAYQELKVRSLTQIAKEIRSLKADALLSVLEVVESTRVEWGISLNKLILQDKVSTTSIYRYISFLLAQKKARSSIK
ncbi:glycosyltransferase family 2 protein [Marinomonas sp. 2405UD66-6]|uniref:glycosyltransferase family 2 protein n=1 Tax=Marinomonas sp. 2405UD66-6 TaxID=3391834 RepID=UPI0039C9CACB